MRRILFTLILLAACLSASAYDFMVDGIAFNKNDDGNTVTVTYTAYHSSSNYNGGSGSLVIPEKVTYEGKTYTVTAIGNDAFFGCSGFNGSLNIPGSVTSIGNQAFSGCNGFTGSLNIPNSVTYIGGWAFRGCSGFTGSLTIPNSVTSIGYMAFGSCSGFTGSLTIGNSVTEIDNHAFNGCSGFTGSLTIPNSVTSIGQGAFQGCSGFTGSLTIGNSVTAIELSAFSGCRNISLVISNNPVPPSANRGAFYNVYAPLQVPSGSVEAYRNAEVWKDFSLITDKEITQSESGDLIYIINEDNASVTLCGPVNKATITKLNIPNTVSHNGKSYPVTIIREYAFYGCSGLTGSLTIGNSVTAIGNYAFEGCSGFNGSLTIPNSVTSIGNYAFNGCNSINEVNVSCKDTEDFANYIQRNDISDIFYNGSLYSKQHNIYIGGKKIDEITIPNSVTSIGDWAFRSCSGLTGTLTIGNSVTSIGERAFEGCSGFNGSLTIGNSVTSIGSSAFYECSGFNGSLTIGNSVTSIGDWAFRSCSGFNGSLTIGNSVTSIGERAFYGCSGLTSVTIPNSVTSIGDEAFYYCSSINEVNVSCKDTEDFANYIQRNDISHIFYNGNSWHGDRWYSKRHNIYIGGKQIDEITIPSSVTSIGNSAFYGCSGLTSVTIHNSVTSIGSSAFVDCYSINEVNVSCKDTEDFANYIQRNDIRDIFYNGSLYSKQHNIYIGGKQIDEITIPSSVTSVGAYAFCNCSGLTGSLNIPSSVTIIGEYAFHCCSGLTGSLTIPSSVTSIGSSAFFYCDGVNGSLTIPNSVTSIGGYAFYYCDSINEVNVSCKDTEDFANYIQRNDISDIFYNGSLYSKQHNIYIGGKKIDEITIPSSVTSVGAYAFRNCSGLTDSLTIPNSVTSIGERAFYGCSGLTSVTIPNSVTSIGNSAFSGCNSINEVNVSCKDTEDFANYIQRNDIYNTFYNGSLYSKQHNIYIGGKQIDEITIPSSVTSVGAYAFYNCSGLTSVTIPNSVTSIGSYAFEGCSGLTSVTIPNSVTSIGSYAFEGCSGLTSVTIPNFVTSIGSYAFSGCSGLTSVNIPNSVTSIGGYAFQRCRGILQVISNSPVPPSAGNGAFNNVYAPLQVPSGSVEAYRNAEVWKDFSLITDKEITQFESGDLIYSINEDNASVTLCGPVNKATITKLNIPNTVSHNGKSYPVTIIRGGAFDGCNGITGSLTIPNSVTSIGDFAFFNCVGFTGSLTIPNSVTSIGWSVFYSCSGLTSVTIPNSVTSIGDYAFQRCSGLTSVNIPNSVTSIGFYAFEGCSGLTSVNIPNSVTSIGWSAFQNCSGLTSVTIPNSVTSISISAFSGCSGLTSVTIPNSVTSIGDYAFQRCSGLTSVTIPNSVTSIESSAFEGCSGLTSVTIPNSVTSIGFSAFKGCSGLTSVNIPNSVTSIGSSAFSGCSGLTSVTIPNSVTSIGNYAFSDCSGLTEINSLNPTPPTLGYYSFSNVDKSIPLYVPANSIDEYRAADGWKEFYNILPVTNRMAASDIACYSGDTIVMPVALKNHLGDVTALQCDIRLANGMQLATDAEGYYDITLGDRATKRHGVTCKKQADGAVRVLIYASDNKALNGNDGPLFYAKVAVPLELPTGNYGFEIDNIELTSPDGVKYVPESCSATVAVKYARLGDSNHDTRVSIGDVITTAAYVLGNDPKPFVYEAADINGDETVSVSDVVLTGNIVLGRYQPEQARMLAPRMRDLDMMSAEVVESRADGTHTIAIALDNSTDYTAFQADLQLPQGMKITDARLSDRAGRSHSVAMNRIDGNTVRVLSYASDNAVFAGNSGDLLLIDVKGRGDINVTNALFCEPNGCEHELNEITIFTELSGINDITVGDNAPVNVYNTAGQLIRTNVDPATATQGLTPGFYIVGDKKVVVK